VFFIFFIFYYEYVNQNKKQGRRKGGAGSEAKSLSLARGCYFCFGPDTIIGRRNYLERGELLREGIFERRILGKGNFGKVFCQ
jgi:hypothetical protein